MSRPARAKARPVAHAARSLTRERIAGAALALIDREGLAAFSMRRLGAALGVEAMAIYYHFASKEQVLDAVAECLLEGFDTREEPAMAWEDWVRRAAASYRAIALRHPEAFILLAGRRFTTAANFRHLERFFRTLRRAGFDAALSAKAFRTMGYFINGAGLADIASAAAARDPERRTALDSTLDAAAFPVLAKVAPHLRPEKLDGTFAFGLDLVIDGLRQALAARR